MCIRDSLIIGNTSPLAVPENIRQNVFQIRQVDHDEAIRKSLETDTLVVVHPKGRKGVYTGKLFDYLATNKPILAICDPDDLIADLLKDCLLYTSPASRSASIASSMCHELSTHRLRFTAELWIRLVLMRKRSSSEKIVAKDVYKRQG